ncbi:alpha/beta fold hydrolase [Pelagibius sp. Alg239-R121]|uniref:alpha/beta fold hydrolase n=1 Tax=Pelagibius sp. Alg239-R121 TaxID=2993448 RepID=UPI0024A76689|nr:alpha/beta hydrolase [Pelagibius sp. Alg239-R121]
MITFDGGNVDFQDSGSGPAVLFIPGSFSTPAAWRPMQKLLPACYRLSATSLCGYGATEETRSIGDLEMTHEVQVIERVAGEIGQPLHLVGHSFGGTVALATALAGRINVLSLAVFEANPLELIREQGSQEAFDEVHRMSQAFETAYHEGELDAAGRIIDFWGGEGVFAAMPEAVRDYCRKTAYANVLDWRSAFAFHATKKDYAQLKMPVLLVRGSNACSAMAHITDALDDSLPDVRAAVVEGANHFLITSHANDCAGLLADFLARVEGQ